MEQEKQKDFFEEFFQSQQRQLLEKYHHLNAYVKKGATLFVGSSLMEHFPLNELAQSMEITEVVYNRGIGGYKTIDLWNAREICIFELEPKKIFINIGTNDIGDHAYQEEKLIEQYKRLLMEIKNRLPETTIYVMAYYPVNTKDDFGIPEEHKKNMFLTRTNETINKANSSVKKLAEELSLLFIDCNEGLRDETGGLKKEYSTEGLHLNPKAYFRILQNLKPYLS